MNSITQNINLTELFEQGKFKECITLCSHILKSDNFEEISPHFYNIYAACLQKENDIPQAIEVLKTGMEKFPKEDLLTFNLGNLYLAIEDLANALEYFKKTIKINPNRYLALNQIGLIMVKLNQHHLAFDYFELSLKYNNQQHNILNNIANIYRDYKQDFKKAISCYKSAIDIQSNYIDAIYNIAHTLMIMREYEEATKYFNIGYNSEFRNQFLTGFIILKHYTCNWDNLDNLTEELLLYIDSHLKEGNKVFIEPFYTVVMGLNEELQYKLIQNYTEVNLKSFYLQGQSLHEKKVLQFLPKAKDSKIRLGYLSADFQDHPTMHLMNNMIKYHDRDKFEIFVYSLAADDGSDYRENIMTQADHFCDLSSLGQQVAKIAKRINQDQIDILMDVKGYTLFSSPEILALRAAPIQINYLAFPATMGAKFIDFMIADKVSIPKSSQKNYSENILHLNNSYFVADSTMGNKIKAKNLEECGLPKGKIILASFNQPYKIDSEIFDVWMEILAEIENSILWLYAPKGLARINLEKYINQYYVKLKDKIFFADKLTRNEHLSRIKNVDLVLDCKKCNGHTTTIDALSVGVPVVTILGNNIAQRGAASILHTYGLKELIAKNLDEYKNIILGYVSDRKILRELKKKSKDLRKNNTLFATKEYVSKLEKALIKTIKK